jgi:hypothetical protein
MRGEPKPIIAGVGRYAADSNTGYRPEAKMGVHGKKRSHDLHNNDIYHNFSAEIDFFSFELPPA